MKAARLTTVLAMLVAILASATGSTFATPNAQAKVQISATGGYGGESAYLIGEWFPVRVTLNNPAGGDARRVRVAVDSVADDPGKPLETYSREVDLPVQSRKEVTLYAYSPTFNRNLDVRLLDGNTQLDKVTLTLSPYEQQTNLLVGVMSSDTSLLNALITCCCLCLLPCPFEGGPDIVVVIFKPVQPLVLHLGFEVRLRSLR